MTPDINKEFASTLSYEGYKLEFISSYAPHFDSEKIEAAMKADWQALQKEKTAVVTEKSNAGTAGKTANKPKEGNKKAPINPDTEETLDEE